MEFKVSSRLKQELIDVTDYVREAVRDSGVKEGLCNVYVPHATAAVTINENADPNITLDILKALNKSLPDHAGYKHDAVDNNAGAHIKASAIGPSETIPIRDGKMELGTWQDIFICEFDGPRSERRVIVTCIGDK